MSGLSDVERDAERAAQALRVAVAYLSGDTGGISSPQAVLAGEGLAAVERVLAYLGRLRRPGDGASTPYPGATAWQDWCPHRTPGLTSRPPLQHPGHGDPGE